MSFGYKESQLNQYFTFDILCRPSAWAQVSSQAVNCRPEILNVAYNYIYIYIRGAGSSLTLVRQIFPSSPSPLSPFPPLPLEVGSLSSPPSPPLKAGGPPPENFEIVDCSRRVLEHSGKVNGVCKCVCFLGRAVNFWGILASS